MERDEILNMPAGKELDILIAEKIMGWHKVNENNFLHWVNSDGRFQCGVGKYDGYEDEEDFNLLKWHPSESIIWSWEVVEKLCNETGCDVVKVCKRDPELLLGEWSCNFGRGFEAFGDTAPLAICRAALLAVIGGV